MLIYREQVEFCAGNKLAFPKLNIYKRYKMRLAGNASGKGKAKYTYRLKATKINTVRNSTNQPARLMSNAQY